MNWLFRTPSFPCFYPFLKFHFTHEPICYGTRKNSMDGPIIPTDTPKLNCSMDPMCVYP